MSSLSSSESATTIRPSGSVAVPDGLDSHRTSPVAASVPLRIVAACTAGVSKCCTRLPSASAATMCPDGAASTPDSLRNSPSAEPCLPTVPTWWPVALNTSSRWFLASATTMRPSASTATSRMYGNAEPCTAVLNERRREPSGANTCAIVAGASTTTISPEGPAATSVGEPLSWPL